MAYMASWTLVQHTTTYEYQWRGFATVVCYRRSYETWTYECTVDDSSSEPGSPSAPSGATLESTDFRRTLGQPLSKVASATFTKKGTWEVVS